MVTKMPRGYNYNQLMYQPGKSKAELRRVSQQHPLTQNIQNKLLTP